jgi:hypothetical protein
LHRPVTLMVPGAVFLSGLATQDRVRRPGAVPPSGVQARTFAS